MVLSNLNKGENPCCKLVENLSGIAYRILIEDDNRMIFFNDMVQTMTGYSPEELKQEEVCFIDLLILPEDKLRVTNIVKNAIENNVAFEVEYRINNKSGEIRWFSERGRPIIGINGNLSYIDGVILDITNQKEVEKKLKISEESLKRLNKEVEQLNNKVHERTKQLKEYKNRYKSLADELEVIMDHIPAFVYYKNTENQFLRVNKRVANVYNLSKEELVGKSLFDLYPKEVAQAYWDEDLKIISSGKPKLNFEELRETTVGKRWVSTSKIQNINEEGIITGIIGFSKDITERKKVEKELLIERNNIFNILDSMEDGVYIVDSNYEIEYVNPILIKEFGQYEGKKCYTYFHEREEVCPWCKNKEVLKGKTVRWEWYSFKNQKTYDLIDTPLKNADGSISKLEIFRDITERKITEQKLKESEEKYRNQNVFLNNILESLTHPFYVINVKDYTVALANSIASSEGLERGKYCYNLTHDNNKPCEAPCICPLDEIKKTKKACVVEHVHYDKEGNEKIYEVYGYPIIDENGNVVQMIEFALNISNRKIAQKELKKSEENYRELALQWQTTFDAMSECVLLLDLESNILQCNQVTLDFLGKKDYDEIIGHSCLEIIRGNSTMEDRCPIMRMLESNKTETSIAQIGKKWCEISANPIINNEGDLIGAVQIIADITERKKADKALHESEERFRNLIEQSVDGVLLVNEDGKIIEWNKGQEQIIGMKKEDVIGSPIWDILFHIFPEQNKNLEQHERIKGMIKDALKTGVAQWIGKLRDTNIQRVDNKEIRTIQQLSFLIKNENKIMLGNISRDITEQKQIQKEIEEKQATLETIFRAAPIGIGMVKNRVLTQVNEKICSLVGYKRDELLNKSVRILYPSVGEYELVGKEKYEQINKFGIGTVETRFKQKDGKLIDVLISSVPLDLKNLSGGVTFTVLDITERKKSERELIESEEKFRTIAEQALMGILILQDNQVKYVNDALLNIFEYSQKEIVGWEKDALTKLIHPEELKTLREYHKRMRSGETGLKPYNSYRVLTKSGKMKWIDQFSKEIPYKGRSAELVTIVDITEKKEVELELIKLSNLKSELLRRTSHELKTPLVSIKGFSDLLLELHRDKLDTYVIRTIKQIRLGCNRLESLVNDILKTAELESGTVELKKSKENLSHLIKMCVSELEGLSELRNHIIHLDIPDKLICSFEKEQMHEVISNILNNAIKYTPYNGEIEVKSEITDDFIIISIKDNGLGFTEEEKARIFKQFGKIERYGQGYDVISEGSGLGLFMSKKIVNLHGGDIWVESEGKNKGSTFIVRLPIT